MRVLVINSGSSTLKFDLLETDGGVPVRRLAHGLVERIGGEAALKFGTAGGAEKRADQVVRDHRRAVELALEWLGSGAEVSDGKIEAVGHRVVHGGDRFVTPTLIDDSVLHTIEELSELAPLHNPPAVEGIKAAREALGPGVPMVAVFDTAFHATIPAHASTYAIPRELAERRHIRRYGFHGTAHEYMLLRYCELTGTPRASARIITLQLGNGCSATAIKDGRSFDTSMGFTPLEGLVMGTRSGDIDAGIVGFLSRAEGMSAGETEKMLNGRSGLMGLSGRSGDMRDLLGAAGSDPGAALAVGVFSYRARKYVGAYMAALGGADAVVFGGGIGEHAAPVRARILEGMGWCGLSLDPERNVTTTSGEGRITRDDSRAHAYVVSVDEDSLIARHTVEAVTGR